MRIRNMHYTKSKQKPKQTQNNTYSCEYALVAGFSDKKLKTNIFHYKFYMSYFAYACKTEGQNGISRLISALCVNCLSSIPEYSRLNHLDEYLV